MKLAKTYEPNQYEANIYSLWETAAAFTPSEDTGQGTYSLVMPPPNANGNLHIGHALTVFVEDVLVRYNRMLGKSTLFLPGADHAGFETWVVFERQLEKDGKSRFNFSREQLYSMVWDFVAAHRGNMEIQLRQLGTSADWSKLVFTLDKYVIDTAYQTFKKLWNDGLVYRGKRPVNYCTKHRTSFSDIEVDYEDRVTPLYYLKYGPFTLATTRPETKFGDTAVAVHPDDERYQQYVGQEIEVEGVNGPFAIKVVADSEVDPTFGTGVVKVTPAHSLADWDIAQRHNLPAVQIIEPDGRLNDKAGQFAGLTVIEARKAVVEALKEKGLLVKVDDTYKNRIGVCYKCKTVIEPLLMDQWFVKIQPLAQPAIEAIEAGKVTFYPSNKGKVLLNYLKNVHDWNISRQIPWGIPIPAFQNIDDPNDWRFDERVEQETIEIDGKTYKREEDTFDTWFSSGQWPFITTQYLDGGELAKFYPINVLETSGDILFPWVARMIMFGLYITKDVPFRDVYLHGLVLDEHGQKMSKSKGNVLNPQETIAEYGSDALRMGLLANRSAGVDQAFSTGSVVAGRNFSNKLWNMARYIEDKIGDSYTERTPIPETLADHWVLQRLEQASTRLAKLIEQYRFSEATETLYHLVWDDIADWYIEASKVSLNKPLLAYVLETTLKLAHPFAPFVTETIWQTLRWEEGLLIQARWPSKLANFNSAKATLFQEIQEIITEARLLRNLLGQEKQRLVYKSDTLIADNHELIAKLGRLAGVEQVSEPRGLRLALGKHEAWLVVTTEVLHAHRSKLEGRLQECEVLIERLQARLNNINYVNKAPETLVTETKQQLDEAKGLKQRLQDELQTLQQQ